MDNFQKLVNKAQENEHRLWIRFDPSDGDEAWNVKYYPDQDDDAHYYAYSCDLNAACRQLLDEIQGFSKW